MITKRPRNHEIQLITNNEPPLKRRKLANAPPIDLPSMPSASKSTIEWPSQSPSPSPPPMLQSPIDIEIMLTNDDNTYSESDSNESQISLILSNHTTPNGYVSPSPPWGRSPPPPPSQYFHKPNKKKSRWDDKNETMATVMDQRKKSDFTTLINLGVNSLIHSINLQQKKQKKVEPLLLDEHGNPLTQNDDMYDLLLSDDMMSDAEDTDEDIDEFIDDNIMVKSATRSRRSKAFKFIEQGTYTEKAYCLRAKELANLKHKPLRLDIELVAKKLHDDEGLEWLDRVPNVEWWDAPLLMDKNDYNAQYKKEMITDLIENPRILRPELLRDNGTGNIMNTNNGKQGNNNGIPWILTKEERKKMRRMKKKEEHQIRTDEIRLGLREPPEPRLKLSNIVRVLGAAAIRDPTAAESIARAQMWKRRVKHELHNATQMLNPQQRREKKRRKLQEDTSKEVHVTIFVIYNCNKLNKTKVCLNAQQRNLTGTLIMLNTMNEDVNKEIKAEKETEKEKGNLDMYENENEGLSLNMVIVEGGPKGISKYKHLLLNRIKWNEDDNDVNNHNNASNNDNGENCKKIWEGTVAKRAFQTFHQKRIKNESELKKFLKMHSVLSYWDMVKNSPAVTCI